MAWGIGNASNWQLGEYIGDTGGGGVGDTTPPSFVGFPSASNITYLSFRANFTVNEAATVYGIVVPLGSPVPTPAEIIAGQSYQGVTPLDAVNVSAVANVANYLNITNLQNQAENTLRIYMTARDTSGNVQTSASARVIEVTLGSVPVTGGGGNDGTSGEGETLLIGDQILYEVI